MITKRQGSASLAIPEETELKQIEGQML